VKYFGRWKGVAKEKNPENMSGDGSTEVEILDRQQAIGPQTQRHKKVNTLKAENMFSFLPE